MERLHSLLRPIVVKVAMKLNFRFSLRGPDRVSDALATVLSSKGAWEFKTLFELVHANLRAKDFARGGDEMLRLRAHEKLQNFLSAGIVTKNGKEYKGVPKALAAFVKTSAEFNARFASGTHTYPAHKVSGAGAVATVMAEAAKTKPAAKKVKPAKKSKSASGQGVRQTARKTCGRVLQRNDRIAQMQKQIAESLCRCVTLDGPPYVFLQSKKEGSVGSGRS